MTATKRRRFSVLRSQTRKRAEANHLRGLLSQRPAPADRHALIHRIHDLVDRVPTSVSPGVQSADQAVARVNVKLLTVHYKEDSRRRHIDIDDQSTCILCEGKYCNFFCPAEVYRWDPAQKETLVSFGNCIECGACDIGCPYDNIRCHSPRGGYGVENRFG